MKRYDRLDIVRTTSGWHWRYWRSSSITGISPGAYTRRGACLTSAANEHGIDVRAMTDGAVLIRLTGAPLRIRFRDERKAKA